MAKHREIPVHLYFNTTVSLNILSEKLTADEDKQNEVHLTEFAPVCLPLCNTSVQTAVGGNQREKNTWIYK